MTDWVNQNDGTPAWSESSDGTTSWTEQSDQSDVWELHVTAGYVELGYVDYIYVEGELISYAVDDQNNTWNEESDKVTTWL